MWLGHVSFTVPRKYLVEKMKSTGRTPWKASGAKASKHPKPMSTTTSKEPPNSKNSQWSQKGTELAEVFPKPDENPKSSNWWFVILAVRLLVVPIFNIALPNSNLLAFENFAFKTFAWVHTTFVLLIAEFDRAVYERQ